MSHYSTLDLPNIRWDWFHKQESLFFYRSERIGQFLNESNKCFFIFWSDLLLRDDMWLIVRRHARGELLLCRLLSLSSSWLLSFLFLFLLLLSFQVFHLLLKSFSFFQFFFLFLLLFESLLLLSSLSLCYFSLFLF